MKVLNVPSFIGGTSKSDVPMDSPEVLLNMFVEKKEGAENRGYANKKLRSVEGEKAMLDFPFDTGIGCRGLFTASDGTMFAAFGKKVYHITRKGDGSLEYTDIVAGYDLGMNQSRVVFAETGGVDSNVVWVDGSSFLYAYSIKYGRTTVYRTPLRVYKTLDGNNISEETNAEPTHVVCVAGVICINDGVNDTWYYTDPYVLGSNNDKRTIYKLDANGNVVYKDESKVEVATIDVGIAEQAENGVSYLWLDRYSLPKYQTAEYSADKITALNFSNDRIYCFGTKSIQIYTLTETSDAYGNSYSVFSSTGNSTSDNGAEIGATVASFGGNVMWLGSSNVGDRTVWISNGGKPTRISTNDLDRELRSYGNISDAYGFAYAYNGHQFYVLTIPSVKKTWCYDISTSEWFNRSTFRSGENQHWFPSYAVNAFNNVYFGGYKDKCLVQLDQDKYTDFKDDPIIKERTSPIFVNDFAPFRLDAFWIEWNSGSNEKNPTAMLQCSVDGGNTWSDEAWSVGGEIGHYAWRTEWRGVFPCWVENSMPRLYSIRVRISDPVKVVITNARMQITNSKRK